MQVDCINPLDLTAGDIAQWRRLLAARPDAFSSPYVTPDWARAVARHRTDARVAVWRERGEAVAFLPVQRTDVFGAMPLGSPVCDYQALIAPEGAAIDPGEAARALRVGRIDLTAGLVDSALEPTLHVRDVGHVVRFPDGWDGYCAERQASGSKVVARARKKLSKLSRDFPGQVSVEPFSADEAAFDQLIAWKRAQMARTGVSDIFEHAWIAGLVRDTFEMQPGREGCEHFGGAMFVLRVASKPIAVLHCLRTARCLHAWFVAYDNDYAEHSPGLILFAEAIRAAGQAGYVEMDLGPGDYRFKESFANYARPIGAGFIGGGGVSAAYKAAQFQLRSLIERLPVGRARDWPAKAMRRLDIARGLAGSGEDRAA
jgi:CelD/BcsL family acetyltransferase involved in cellulose biosynthesis